MWSAKCRWPAIGIPDSSHSRINRQSAISIPLSTQQSERVRIPAMFKRELHLLPLVSRANLFAD